MYHKLIWYEQLYRILVWQQKLISFDEFVQLTEVILQLST